MNSIKISTKSSSLQKGFLLLETALALLIVSAVGTIALNAQLADLKDQRAIAQAHSLIQVQGGANSYITNYRVQLASNMPITGVASIYDPKVEELAALNVGMPPNFLNAPMIGGSYRVHVATTPSPCTPTDCQITAVSWITQPLKENDGTVDYPRLGLAMQTLGVDGAVSSNIDVTTGAVNPVAAGSIRGPNNAWNMANPAGFVPGIMAARAGFDSQIFNQFVRRDGQSQMTGNLQMGDGVTNNDIVNLKNLTADGLVTGNTLKATTTVTAGGTITGNRLQSAAGSGANGFFDVAGNRLGSGSVTATGSICSGNAALDCSGAGGTVINGSTVSSTNINLTAGSFISNPGTQNISAGQLNLQSASGSVVVGNNSVPTSLQVSGGVNANGASRFLSNTFFGATQNIQTSGWSTIAADGSGANNSAPQSPDGSMSVNDTYIRSAGLWASQIAAIAITANNTANAANTRAMTAGPQGSAGGSGLQGPQGIQGNQGIAGAGAFSGGAGTICFNTQACGASVGQYRSVTCFQAVGPSPGTDAYGDIITAPSIRWNGSFWDAGQYTGPVCPQGFVFT
jgi:hypothetical protein